MSAFGDERLYGHALALAGSKGTSA